MRAIRIHAFGGIAIFAATGARPRPGQCAAGARAKGVIGDSFFRSSSTTTGSGLGQYPVVPHPLEVLMTQQLFSRYPADVVEHGKLGAHLALLMPPLAALLYPFLLEAFHANIAPVISGQSAEPALQSAAALSRRRTSVYPPRQQPGCGRAPWNSTNSKNSSARG